VKEFEIEETFHHSENSNDNITWMIKKSKKMLKWKVKYPYYKKKEKYKHFDKQILKTNEMMWYAM